MRDDGPRRLLIGGQLPLGLRAVGASPGDIDTVICTHLHADHCGWLFDAAGAPVFRNADIWLGAGDWEHFVLGPEIWMFDHIRHGLQNADGSRMSLVTRDTTVATGIDIMMTPGHTPGHLSVIVSSGGQRALLLGDAIACPLQLEEPTWQSTGDDATPDTLRYRIWHIPARLVRHARKRILKISPDWPWKDAFITCWNRLLAIPAPG